MLLLLLDMWAQHSMKDPPLTLLLGVAPHMSSAIAGNQHHPRVEQW